MASLELRETVMLNILSAECKRRNLNVESAYHTDRKEAKEQILLNQQLIMLMLSELLWKNAHELEDTIKSKVKHDAEYDRWVID